MRAPVRHQLMTSSLVEAGDETYIIRITILAEAELSVTVLRSNVRERNAMELYLPGTSQGSLCSSTALCTARGCLCPRTLLRKRHIWNTSLAGPGAPSPSRLYFYTGTLPWGHLQFLFLGLLDPKLQVVLLPCQHSINYLFTIFV